MGKIKLKPNEVLVDGTVMTLEELGITKITTYAEQRAQQLFRDLYADIPQLEETTYHHGHMGFPSENIDKTPFEMKSAMRELVKSSYSEFDKLLEEKGTCTND